ncbi:hypothetical protein SAMN04489707_10106 [Paenacidovorax caeni]|uniref:Uncharacterized protein n=1 Tax=Paenacidovorax caeni TaxID=343013 RepID=A0A1I7HD02_9BURK|nr:hypothetical protein SAMN04489707_10106 [Paenacidovorax caeni]
MRAAPGYPKQMFIPMAGGGEGAQCQAWGRL